MSDWVGNFLSNSDMLTMGHWQSKEDNNLGLGWIYYSLARLQRCEKAVAIGSYRGFAPFLIAKGLQDNQVPGELLFIDPSRWDEFWSKPAEVAAHFKNLGVSNIQHHRMTTQEFVQTKTYASLSNVGLVFIDGLHTYEQVRFDFEAFAGKLAPDAIVLLNVSMSLVPETYGGIEDFHITGVTFYVDELEARPDFQVFDFPRPSNSSMFGVGLTLVRRKKMGCSDYYRNAEMPGYDSLKRGIALFNDHKLEDSIEHFNTVLEQHQTFAAAWLLKGTALACAGKIEEGLECMRTAGAMGDRRASALINGFTREFEQDKRIGRPSTQRHFRSPVM